MDGNGISLYFRRNPGRMMVTIRNIVLIGAGRLASSLAFSLKGNGFEIIQVVNRSPQRGKQLAARVGAEYIPDLEQISSAADICIIAVSDDAVFKVVSELKTDKLVVHTSGSLPLEVLDPASENSGVVYPLFTFSGRGKPDFRKIPVCIEANSETNLALLDNFISTISEHVLPVVSADRLKIHLAAVFSNNFANFMVSVAGDLLRDEMIDPAILGPLIRQTAKTIVRKDPFQFQTGPAVRKDERVIAKHLELLRNHPDYQAIYRQVTEGIENMKKRHG
jgi:predicted short-subunit dehydrogenase-like oxidoreductase (DUF2520 family)